MDDRAMLVRDDLSQRLDEMADLCEHWRRWREKRGHTPQAIRAALVMLAHEVSLLDSMERRPAAAGVVELPPLPAASAFSLTRSMFTADDMHAYARDALAAASAQPAREAVGLTDAARDVLAERRRQVEVEGWTPEHDDEHSSGDLAQSAVCYAMGATFISGASFDLWPWDRAWWKPKDRRSNLVRAAALLLAEIERLDRATNNLAPPSAEHDSASGTGA